MAEEAELKTPPLTEELKLRLRSQGFVWLPGDLPPSRWERLRDRWNSVRRYLGFVNP